MTRVRIILTLGLLLVGNICYCQYYNREPKCSNDTVPIYRYVENNNFIKLYMAYDSVVVDYYARYCTTRSKIGFRFEISASKYQYPERVSDWIGNHWGPNFNFIFVYDKLNFGYRFKPATVNPKSELIFNNNLLTHEAKLNPVKTDYYIGYSFDFPSGISIEPSIGYTRTSFHVINEKELNTKFNIKSSSGLILGMTLNKYFKLKKYNYISLFFRTNYGFVNYQKTHDDLGVGYFELNAGVAYKLYFEEGFYKRI